MIETNGNTRNDRLRARFWSIGLLVVIIVSLLCEGCRSSRKTVEETCAEIHATLKENVTADTLHTTAATHEVGKDSAEVRADERALIKIKRDTAGRVVEIDAARIGKVKSIAKRKTDRDFWFYGLNATRSSEAAQSVGAIAQKKKETDKEVKTSKPLDFVIGGSVVLIILILFLVDVIYRLWKRKWGK